jgi:2-polyprenyl-6-methoxyphenol hydroxylase-like FAD-dependent oxidoreductase
VAETQRLGLYDVLREAGGVVGRWRIAYDDTRTPEEAEAQRADMSQVLPGVASGLYIGSPVACAALSHAAEVAGAAVVLGVEHVSVTSGTAPAVEYAVAGRTRRVRCALIVGADGRTSTVRQQAGIPLRRAAPTHLIAGLLVGEVSDWPQDSLAVGTEGDLHFLIFPQGRERVRLYSCIALDQRDHFAGPQGPPGSSKFTPG